MNKPALLFSFLFLPFFHHAASAQWVQTGKAGGAVTAFAFFGEKIFAATSAGEVCASTDSGAHWTAAMAGLPVSPIQSLVPFGPDLFAGARGNGVYRTTDNGNTWASFNKGLPDSNIYALAATGHRIFCSVSGGVFNSTNGGNDWMRNYGLNGYDVLCFATDNEKLYAGSSTGLVVRSSDEGESWSAIGYNIVSHILQFSLAVGAGKIFAGTDKGLLRSSDGGATWTGIDETRVHCVIIKGANVCVTSDRGVWFSRNGGDAWTDIGGGLADTYIFAMTMNETTLFVSTAAAGVWRRPLSELTAADEPQQPAPRDFLLKQNYPNPFSFRTTIEFSLPKAERVTLEVYDLFGRKIATLVDGFQSDGTHAMEWNKGTSNPGMYFYRLKAGLFISTRKMVVEK